MGIKTQDNTLSAASTTSYPFENNNKLKRQPAIDENLMAREQQNLLNATGQTSTQSDPRQIEKAISMLVANSNLYTTSGTANAIILTTKTINSANTNSIQMSNLHFDEDGAKYEFVASFTNTGATTVVITGFLTAQNVVDINGAALIAGSIINGRRYTLIRDKINNRFVLFTVQNLSNVTRTIILGPVINTVQTQQEIVKFYDNAGNLVWKRITGLEATDIVAGANRVITYAEAFTASIDNFIGISVQSVTPANGILFPQTFIGINALTQFTLFNTDFDSTLNVYRWSVSGV
jgi:hypothetical protein